MRDYHFRLDRVSWAQGVRIALRLAMHTGIGRMVWATRKGRLHIVAQTQMLMDPSSIDAYRPHNPQPDWDTSGLGRGWTDAIFGPVAAARSSRRGVLSAESGRQQGVSVMSKRTITLTNRPPVTIDDTEWPMIASASDDEHDGQVECQANRKSKWFLGVRQHEDGRAIVYATYGYTSNWQNARCYSTRAGQLLPTGTTDQAICEAIREVADVIAGAECDGDDAGRWPTIANACIADMPAEELE